MSHKQYNLAIAAALILMVVGLRLLPHPANFAPVAAAAIFGGAILPRKVALWVPLSAMVVSDLVIGLHELVLLTWGCYFLFALAASHWLRKLTLLRTGCLAISSSLTFFVVTNFGVWAASGMYTHTWDGLARCFYMALPFFRNTLLSDLFYTAALFGLYFLATNLSNRLTVNQKLRSDQVNY